MARIEFWKQGTQQLVAAVYSDAVPRAGEFVNIRGEAWKIAEVTWAVDYSVAPEKQQLRANVELTSIYGERP